MKIRTLVDNQHRAIGREIRIELQGRGGELGIQSVQRLIELINQFKTMNTEREVNDHYTLIMGYCLCCENCGFIDEKGADDLMQAVALLASNELVRMKGAKE